MHPLVPLPSDVGDIVIRGDKIFVLLIIFNACFVIFSASDTTMSFAK